MSASTPKAPCSSHSGILPSKGTLRRTTSKTCSVQRVGYTIGCRWPILQHTKLRQHELTWHSANVSTTRLVLSQSASPKHCSNSLNSACPSVAATSPFFSAPWSSGGAIAIPLGKGLVRRTITTNTSSLHPASWSTAALSLLVRPDGVIQQI